MAKSGRSNNGATSVAERTNESMAAAAPAETEGRQSTRIPFQGVTARPPEGRFRATYNGGKWRTPKDAGKDDYWAGDLVISEGETDPANPDRSLAGRHVFKNWFPYSEDSKPRFKDDFIVLGVEADEFENPEGIDVPDISAQAYGAPCVVEIEHQKDSDKFYNVKVLPLEAL